VDETPAAGDRLEELYAAAIELEGAEREHFLSTACGDDDALHRELHELLQAADEAAVFFDGLSAAIVEGAGAEIETAARPQTAIGPYRAVRLLGHGGMGAVYLGVRADGAFEQEVALKLLHLDMETAEMRGRFLAERQLLARLSHPNIARLLDGGVTEEGRPFFAMEYVEGISIAAYCQRNGLAVDQILRLFLQVVAAVSYLHRNLIVHRDLKPSNIMVTAADGVKLLDFGIAKLLAEGAGAAATRAGQQPMTPGYAAPEQRGNQPVTTATDVWALGAVLYELLTGERAQASETPASHTHHSEPPPPSSRRRGIAKDLDTICLKALRADPNARYDSAEQLGEDLERYLTGLPIRARPSTWGYRLSRFVRRRRAGVAVAALLVVLVAASFVTERRLRSEAEASRLVAQQEQAEAEASRALARREEARAVAVSDFLAELLSSVDPARAQGRDVAVADVLAEASARLESGTAFREQPEVEAALRLTIGRTYTALRQFEQAEPHLLRALELSGGGDSDQPRALEVAAALGIMRFRSGDYEAAEPILLRVLDRRTEVLGQEHPATLASLGDLASLYWYQRRLDEVEALDRRNLAICRRVLGAEHPDTLRALNGLATTLYSRGRYDQAAELFAEALPGSERLLGPDHPQTLRLVNNLASALSNLGRFEEAETLGRRAVEGRARVLGERHPDTATAVHNLGIILLRLGRYEAAEGELARALELREGSPGAYWYSTLWLAHVRRGQGRLAEAEDLLERAIAGFDETDGPQATTTLGARAALAAVELALGRVASAAARIEAVLALQREQLGQEHPDVLESRLTLARVRRAQGRLAEAIALARDVHAARSAARGPNHPETILASQLVAELSEVGDRD
jgi:serine/threonine-protein kinase